MPITAITAGFVAILVGYTGSAAIIFQAARAGGANQAEIASWMGALGIGMGITCITLSLRFRAPIITAWSTPGAAILVGALVGVEMSDAIGAFLFSGLLITVLGLTGWFERVMHKIPLQIAAAMLAGVLARFGMDVFVAMQDQIGLVLPMFITYLAFKRYSPRYVVIVVFLLGILLSSWFDLFQFQTLSLQLTKPVFTTPTFNFSTLIGVGIPLFLVTMASQNIPGVAVLKTSGYDSVPISPLITTTGLATVVLAPFGGFALNLAAITAAICTGPEAHPDKEKRYLAGIATGIFALIAGVFGATISALFVAFPSALVFAIAGIALLGTITTSLSQALAKPTWREPALVTFLVTLSGITLFGIGSAFWGLVAGGLAMVLLGKTRA